MSTVNGFLVGSETLKYNYESLDNYNTPNFSTSSSVTYAVGDYVMYNGKLYKCTTATTGGTWVSGSWAVVVLSDDVSDLNRQLSDAESAFNYVSYRKNLIGNEANVYYPIVPLKSGEALTISTSNGEAADQTYTFSFYSENKALLGQSQFKPTDGAYKVYDTARTWGAIIGTCYISINKQGTVPFQAELGRAATTYEPYFPNGLLVKQEVDTLKTNQNILRNDLNTTDGIAQKTRDDFAYVSYRKNLIGNEANIYYPLIPLKSTDIFTISTSNGEAPDQTYIFSFYNSAKSLLGQLQFKPTDGASRTIDLSTVSWSLLVGTCYISINKQGTVPLQFELGNTATTYEAYFPNGLMTPQEIARVDTRIDLADAKTNANYNDLLWMTYPKNIVGNDDSVYYPIIPLKATDYLTFSTQSGNAPESTLVFDFYDASKALMGKVSFGPSHGASRTIHIGTTFSGLLSACYVRPEQMSPDPVQIELGQTATAFEEYVPNSKRVSEIISNERMDNATWMVIGDSLTDPTTLGTGVKIYANYVADKTGLTVINKGVGGTGYWRGTDTNKAFYQRIASFTDPAPNIITFFGSFNDLGTDSRGIHGTDILGTASDSTADTIGGCINLTLDAVITYAPDALLGIIAPTEWQGYYYDTNSRAYVQLLEDIAKYRGIPFLNLYTSSNLRPNKLAFRNTYYLNADGTHPNTLGHKRFAGLVEQFIKGIYYV